MAQHMHGIVLEVTKYVIGVAQFISLTCDEVSTIDNQNMFMWFKIGYKY